MKINKQDLVSVVTPVYNSEKYIKKTIDSVLAQSYENLELILVDDCSTDYSKKIIEDYKQKDSRIKLISLKKNSGAAIARNTGIKKATGNFIAFIDSDDQWNEEKLEKQLKFMKINNYGFTFTAYEMVKDAKKIKNVIVPEKIEYKGLLKNTVIGCSTVMINKDIIGDFKMPNVRKGQDTLTWLKILENEPFAYGLNSTLTKYRIGNKSISSNKISALKRTWSNYRKFTDLNLFETVYYYVYYIFNAIKRRIIY